MGGRGSSSGLSNGSGISTVERKICHDEVESAYLFDTDGNVIFSKSDNTETLFFPAIRNASNHLFFHSICIFAYSIQKNGSTVRFHF